jgi:hypothetical protein
MLAETASAALIIVIVFIRLSPSSLELLPKGAAIQRWRAHDINNVPDGQRSNPCFGEYAAYQRQGSAGREKHHGREI